MAMKAVRLIGALAAALCAAGCISISLSPFGSRAELEEETLESARKFRTSSKVAVVSVDGVITGESRRGFRGSDSTVVRLKDQLQKAERDSRVKAVVVRLDSPGGGVTASDLLHREITRFRENTGVPVFVSMINLGASGAYYAAMAADEVYAQPTTVTGSIGVIAVLPKFQPLTQKIGVDMRIIKSGETKDLGSLWRDFAPGEREIIQGMIDEFHARFVAVIEEGRPNLSPERIRELADGRVFTAEQATQEGLIDGVMYLDEVIEAAKEAAGLTDARVVAYKRRYDYKGHIYAQGGVGAPEAGTVLQLDLGDAVSRFMEPRFQYLWMP